MNMSLSRTLAVTAAVAIGCSVLVSTAVYYLRPLQLANASVAQNTAILDAAGLLPSEEALSDREIQSMIGRFEPALADVDAGELTTEIDVRTYNQRAAASDPAASVAIPADADIARLGTRARYARIYVLRARGSIERIVLPIHGQGMWSTIYGYICLESDLNTIVGVSFYEHGETAGIGDRILSPEWRGLWTGKQLYDDAGSLRFAIVADATEQFEVDAISGATVTTDAVGTMIAYWFGDHGFRALLQTLSAENPSRNGPQ